MEEVLRGCRRDFIVGVMRSSQQIASSGGHLMFQAEDTIGLDIIIGLILQAL